VYLYICKSASGVYHKDNRDKKTCKAKLFFF